MVYLSARLVRSKAVEGSNVFVVRMDDAKGIAQAVLIQQPKGLRPFVSIEVAQQQYGKPKSL